PARYAKAFHERDAGVEDESREKRENQCDQEGARVVDEGQNDHASDNPQAGGRREDDRGALHFDVAHARNSVTTILAWGVAVYQRTSPELGIHTGQDSMLF